MISTSSFNSSSTMKLLLVCALAVAAYAEQYGRGLQRRQLFEVEHGHKGGHVDGGKHKEGHGYAHSYQNIEMHGVQWQLEQQDHPKKAATESQWDSDLDDYNPPKKPSVTFNWDSDSTYNSPKKPTIPHWESTDYNAPKQPTVNNNYQADDFNSPAKKPVGLHWEASDFDHAKKPAGIHWNDDNYNPPKKIASSEHIRNVRGPKKYHGGRHYKINGKVQRKLKPRVVRRIKIEGSAPYVYHPALYKMIASSVLSKPPPLIYNP